MTKWLIVSIVRIIILENRKWFLFIYSNLNTFHVESLFKFKTIWNSYSNTLIRKKKAGTTFRTENFQGIGPGSCHEPGPKGILARAFSVPPKMTFRSGWYHQPGRKGRPFVPVGGMNRDQCPENLMAPAGTFRPASSYKPGPMSPFSNFFQTF